jgi:cell division protein FtsB
MKKDKIKQIIKNKLKVYRNYLIILVIIVLSMSIFRNISRMRKSDERIKQAQERVEELKERKTELEIQLEEVQSDFYTEKQLRDNLGLIKEGETIVILPEEDIVRKLAPKFEEEEDSLPDPNWRKWAKLFGI